MVVGRYSALCKAKSIRKADPLPRRPARGSLQSATSSMARGPPPSTSPTPFPPSLLTSGLWWSVNKKTLIRNPSIRKTVVKVFLDFHHSAVMLAEAGAPDRPCISSSGGRAGRRASVAVPRQMSATIPTRHNPNICHNPNFTDNARPLLSATVLQQHSAGQLWWRGREERTGTSKPNMVKKILFLKEQQKTSSSSPGSVTQKAGSVDDEED